MPYDPRSVEPKWQARWRDAGLHRTTDDPTRRKLYILDMFPYPSGAGLHVGHVEGYTATDIVTRSKRMQGWNVLHPMGWDAFGLPAENYAIKTGVHPRVTTAAAIANFRRQIDAMGFAYDWEREINTTDPGYVRWTQWIFLQIFKRGLAYQGVVPINWCPSCKTGLANEEVVQGRCDRCATPVERKDMNQWLLRITRYADRLADDLSDLDWPASTVAMQRNWIGRSEGAEVVFRADRSDETIKVFTTRPDTLHGATYMVLAPEHRLVDALTTPDRKQAVADYRATARFKSDLERTDLAKEKTGVFTGGHAINPVNGAKIPVWIADYVLASYGTGAIMAVPAHDDRDHAFAVKFGLPIEPVVRPATGEAPLPFVDDGVAINSGSLDGLPTAEAKAKITAELEARGLGKRAVSYKLRDWVFARQRYWGEPIPIIHCPEHGAVAVPDAALPVLLPDVERYQPSGTGESPLATITSWVSTTCPTCGGPARRETDTMPQWAGSCWYYLRYLDPKNPERLVSPAAEQRWMPIDLYVGGAEHSVLHLLYARFWHKVLFDLGHVSTKEPFVKLRHPGLVLGRSYQDAEQRYHAPADVEVRPDGSASLKATGAPLKVTIEKMAKTALNGVNPEDVIAEHSADVLRLYEMFMGDFELPKPWDPRAIEGLSRFVRRVWRLVEEHDPAKVTGDPHLRLRHKTIKKVTSDLDHLKFNTAIAALMEYVNELVASPPAREDLSVLIRLVGPFAPYLGDEAWERLGERPFLIQAAWPTYDDALTLDDVVTLAVQVNGKVRASIEVARTAPEAEVRERALAQPNVQKHLEGKTVRKVIVVPGKIVNIVVG